MSGKHREPDRVKRRRARGRSSGQRRQRVGESLRHALEAEPRGMELVVPPRPVVGADGERPAKVDEGHVRERAQRGDGPDLRVEAVDQLLGQRDALGSLAKPFSRNPGSSQGPGRNHQPPRKPRPSGTG